MQPREDKSEEICTLYKAFVLLPQGGAAPCVHSNLEVEHVHCNFFFKKKSVYKGFWEPLLIH